MWSILWGMLSVVLCHAAIQPTTEEPVDQTNPPNATHCESFHDTVVEWPRADLGEISFVKCPKLSTFNPNEFAQRTCYENGTWSRPNYLLCVTAIRKNGNEIDKKIQAEAEKHSITAYIYLAGFSTSNLFMMIAFSVFCCYRRLRCARNQIHCNLLIAMTVKNFAWMALLVDLYYGGDHSKDITQVKCITLRTFYKLFLIAQYSWMLVEGLYLFLMCVKGLLTDVFKLKHCMLIGWGIPVVLTLIWVMLDIFTENENSTSCWRNSSENSAPYLFEIISILLLLFVNFIFLLAVVVTVYKKNQQHLYKSSSTHTKYIKAVKATTVLIPLLGAVYVLLIIPPPIEESAKHIWDYIQAAVQSTQGLFVAVVHCFINKEVQSSLKRTKDRWRSKKSIPTEFGFWLLKRRRSSAITQHRDNSTDVDILSQSRRGSKPTEAQFTGIHQSNSNVDLNSNTHTVPTQNTSDNPTLIKL